jgi:hypothetical protein
LLVLAALVVVWLATRPPAPKPTAPKAFVPIREGATIDFSSGKPVVKQTAEEKALIDATVKEMDAAARNIRFAPIAPPKVEPDRGAVRK